MATTDLRTAELKHPVDVAEYLFTRLRAVGVQAVHGVPGDFNLVALDYIPKCGLHWVGNVNELNAGNDERRTLSTDLWLKFVSPIHQAMQLTAMLV